MNDLEANLREAAARVGYYNERGEWVNAEWMAEAADYIDSLTAERDSAAETADIQMRFLAKAETRLAAAEQERDELRHFVKECQALAAPLGIKEALRRLAAAEAEAREWDATLLECSEQRSRLAAAEQMAAALRGKNSLLKALAGSLEGRAFLAAMDEATVAYSDASSGLQNTDDTSGLQNLNSEKQE